MQRLCGPWSDRWHNTGVWSCVSPDCSAAPGSCMLLLIARFSHSPTRSVMTPLQHPVCCWCIALASYQPPSLRSFSSDRSHTLSHASYLRDSAMIDDTVVIPSQQVSKPLQGPSGLQRSGNRKGAGQMCAVCCLVHLSTNLSVFQAYLMAYWAVQCWTLFQNEWISCVNIAQGLCS